MALKYKNSEDYGFIPLSSSTQLYMLDETNLPISFDTNGFLNEHEDAILEALDTIYENYSDVNAAELLLFRHSYNYDTENATDSDNYYRDYFYRITCSRNSGSGSGSGSGNGSGNGWVIDSGVSDFTFYIEDEQGQNIWADECPFSLSIIIKPNDVAPMGRIFFNIYTAAKYIFRTT